jgi:polysaccharide export outer membrane protein
MNIHAPLFGAVVLGLFASIDSSAFAQVGGVAPPVVPVADSPAGLTSSSTVANAEYVLGPEDVIEVEVVGQTDKWRAKIYADGTIQLNLIGKIPAAGRTPRQLAEDIAVLLKSGGFFANPTVNVDVSSYSSRYVTVLGSVASPSLVPINRSYRLSEILARVGGAQNGAADYLVVRPEQGGERRYELKDLAMGDATKDPFVTAGDKIYVPLAEQFYVSGQVHSPGTFAMKTGMTVGQAIAVAGGLSPSGSDKKVTVTRDGKKAKLSSADLVRPGDVLVVGERLF